MLTTECWFAFHDDCVLPGWCDCGCHIDFDTIDLDKEWADQADT